MIERDWKRIISSSTDATDYNFTTTESSGNSATPGPPPEGPNVALIVGLSVGIPVLLCVLSCLLYITRAKWLPFCTSCLGKSSNRSYQRNQASTSNDRNSVAFFPETPPPPVPSRESGNSYRSPGPSGTRPPSFEPLSPQSLLIDFSSSPAKTNFEAPIARAVIPGSAFELTPTLIPPTLPPRPLGPRSPPPPLANREDFSHNSEISFQPSSITPKEKYPLSAPTRSMNPEIALEFEFSKLQFVNLPCTVASSLENKNKNRYMDTLPFDHNRVELSSGQYINASHIGSKFIVTQDPMMVVDDDDILWAMAWEKNIDIIVRLSADEAGSNHQLGCAPYMPVGRSVYSNNLEVKLVSGPSDEHQYVYRAVKLSKTAGEGKGERQVEHYHLKNWNSSKPPPELDLLRALCVIRERHRSILQKIGAFRDTRILVHCGAGSSRSGTFIAVWKCMDSIDGSTRPKVFDIVQEIRNQRSQAVNKLELYEYIYTCVALYTEMAPELNASSIYDVYSVSGEIGF